MAEETGIREAEVVPTTEAPMKLAAMPITSIERVQREAMMTRDQALEEMARRVAFTRDLMIRVMQTDTHYGKIPGSKKGNLLKPGAEVLYVAYQCTAHYRIEDLSELPEFVRYRVHTTVVNRVTGLVVGEGVGEASSDEEKYKWRSAICDQEFEETDPSRRRSHWKTEWVGKYPNKVKKVVQIKQVRTEPPDLANTILKMAKKRSYVDGGLTAFGASEFFSQDYDELPSYLKRDRGEVEEEQATGGNSGKATEGEKEKSKASRRAAPPAQPASPASPQADPPTSPAPPDPEDDFGGALRDDVFDLDTIYKSESVPKEYPPITPEQVRRLYAKARAAGIADKDTFHTWLKKMSGFTSAKEVPQYATYDHLCDELDKMALLP